MPTEVNLQASPSQAGGDQAGGADSPAEKLRKEHIGRESTIITLGYIFVYSGFALAGTTALGKAVFKLDSLPIGPALWIFISLAYFAALTIVGYGLTNLKSWVPIPAAIVAILSLYNVPFGTIVGAYMLWLVFSKKGRVIFSPEYAAIVAATPHIEPPRTGFMQLFLVAIAIMAAFAVLGPLYLK